MSKLTLRPYTIEEYHMNRRFNLVDPLFHPCNGKIAACDAWKYVPEMIDLMHKHDGSGISANQVGLDIPLFVLFIRQAHLVVFKPKIIHRSESMSTAMESCLSFPTAATMVSRHKSLTVEFIYQANNKRLRLDLWGQDARLFQHENDHLSGKLIFDYGNPCFDLKLNAAGKPVVHLTPDKLHGIPDDLTLAHQLAGTQPKSTKEPEGQ